MAHGQNRKWRNYWITVCEKILIGVLKKIDLFASSVLKNQLIWGIAVTTKILFLKKVKIFKKGCCMASSNNNTFSVSRPHFLSSTYTPSHCQRASRAKTRAWRGGSIIEPYEGSIQAIQISSAWKKCSVRIIAPIGGALI